MKSVCGGALMLTRRIKITGLKPKVTLHRLLMMTHVLDTILRYPVLKHQDVELVKKKALITECKEYKWQKIVEEELTRRSYECDSIRKHNKFQAMGGRPTYLGEFPHMGAIGWKANNADGYLFKCGSTLISSNFVLTAAHCSKAALSDLNDTAIVDVVPKIVRLGDKNLYHKDSQGIYFSEDAVISRIIVHPRYMSPKQYFDIALMELQDEVIFSKLIQPACLWIKEDELESAKNVTLTGWGVLHSGSKEISPELQAVDLKLIGPKHCDQLLYSRRNRNWWGLQDYQLCAGNLTGGADACHGDSGGPLQVKEHVQGSENKSIYYVIGVTSFGIGCGRPNSPGVYSRVSSFLDWIEKHVWP